MDHIFTKHKHWVKVVERFGEKHYAEDVVQEAYIKVMALNKEINEAYFYYTLRSLTMNLHKHKVVKTEITPDIEFMFVELDEPVDINEILSPYLQLINTWQDYDKLLYLSWVRSGFSIRKFSREIDISFMSVYHTINNCKKRIKQWQKENHKA